MQENRIGNKVEITHENHSKYVEELIKLVRSGNEPDVPIDAFIEKIMKKKEYKVLCNAIFLFINNRPATKPAGPAPEAEPEAVTADIVSAETMKDGVNNPEPLLAMLNKVKNETSIQIPYKNKMVLDYYFKSYDLYKVYLSFYIINYQYI